MKNPVANVGDTGDKVQSLGREDPLQEEMATPFSILAWEIPWIEESGRLQPMGTQSQTRLSTRVPATAKGPQGRVAALHGGGS